MTALVALLRAHGDAVEADLLRFYRVDLGDLYRGELSLRRLSVLIKHLPSESATVRARSALPTGWDLHAYLLADLFHAFAGQPHPARPKASEQGRYSETRKRLEQQAARLAARKSASSEAPAG